ncbi:MAG TPA: ABC transporter permease [Candidatus Limnocylindrales bacterium]|nr:ABC transporter permease [Candidatus Limnocylindrales bacterium]
MTATTLEPLTTTARGRGRGRGIRRTLARWALPTFTGLAIVYLLIPIAVMFLFSFNRLDQSLGDGRSNYQWHAFSLDAWAHPFDWPGLADSIRISLTIAALSTVGSTILGTLIGLSLTRYSFRGRGLINGLIFLPMATPEVVMGASLLTLFVATVLPPLRGTAPALYPTGFLTILIAHVMFNISYVVVTVKARLAGFDRRLEEAAMDLGANEWTTFWRVTFPLILPGILAAALLAFSLSIDDFVITSFVSGTTNTFPILVYSIQKNALPVQINVIGSVIFFAAVAVVAVTTLVQARRNR